MGFAKAINDPTKRLDSNSHTAKYSTANSEYVTVHFGRHELRTARNVLRKVIGEVLPIHPSGVAAYDDSSKLRVARALYFTAAARMQNDLGLKIANYCSALEALFATDSHELTHQLAERTAAFLEDLPQDRLILYKKLKAAYSIRSIVVHGVNLRVSRAEQYQETTMLLDCLLRRVFNLVIHGGAQSELLDTSKSDFTERMMLRVFGSEWESQLEHKDQAEDVSGREEPGLN